MSWTIDYHESCTPEEIDGDGWLWHLFDTDGATRRIHVVVTREAILEGPAAPQDTREAIKSEGETEVWKLLEEADVPPRIDCCADGCHWAERKE